MRPESDACDECGRHERSCTCPPAERPAVDRCPPTEGWAKTRAALRGERSEG